MSLVLLAELAAKPGKAEAVLDVLGGLIKPSLAEPGCMGYRPLVDPAAPDRVVCLEEWADEDALQSHFGTDYFQKAAAQLNELLAEPFTLRRLQPVEVH